MSLLLNGCGTTYISGNISTSIDPSFVPRTNLRVVVVPKDLDAVYYLPVLREALENRGFTNISISRSNKVSPDYFDIKVFLGVGRNILEETETVNDYGIVGQNIDPGDFKCKTSNNGLTGARMRCRASKTEVENIYGVTGTREVTTTSLSRSISLSFTSLSNNQSVISAIGTSDVSDYRCSNAGIYKFLIIHTLKRLDFSTPRNFDYIVELPEGYDCESSLEYERFLRGGVSTGQVASNTKTHEPQAKTYGSYLPGYIGDWKYSQRHGQGTQMYDNGTKYVGEWKKHWRHGLGTITFANGDKYVGQFKDDKYNGQGTFTWADGDKYVGQFSDNKRNGQGTYTLADGRKQEGQWVDGEFYEASSGDRLNKKAARTYSEIVADRKKAASKEAKKNTGNITKPNRSSSIVGCIYGNCVNGQGTYNYAKGSQYVGYWEDGKRNGQGTYNYASGDQYVGYWEDGKRNGQGTYTWADGRKQEGQWIDGKFDKASLGDSLSKKSVLERADNHKTGLIQVKLNNSTEYSCLYAHDGMSVVLNVFQVPRRICPKHVDWPAKDSTKIFDMTQNGTNHNVGASLKLNKGSGNSNVCAYSVLHSEADLLIPKGSGAVCPQKYRF